MKGGSIQAGAKRMGATARASFEAAYLRYRITIQADAKHPGADIASNRQGFKAVAAKKQASACKPGSCWPSRARSRSLAGANSGGTPALVTYNQSVKQWLAGQGTHSRVFWHLRPDNPVNRHKARRFSRKRKLSPPRDENT